MKRTHDNIATTSDRNIQQLFQNVKPLFLSKSEFSKVMLGYKNIKWVNKLIKEGILVTADIPFIQTSRIIPATELERLTKKFIIEDSTPKRIKDIINQVVRSS